MRSRVDPQAGYDTHVYFVPAQQLKQEILDRNKYVVRVGRCIVHIEPLEASSLNAVTLRCPQGTPSFERRQALRVVAREEALPLVLPSVIRMLELVKMPNEGPVPLMSLSQLLRVGIKNWYEIYDGQARRILNPRLLREMEAVTARADDNEDVRVERLCSGPCCGKEHPFAQFGAFATRDLAPCAVFASYSRGAMITPVEEVTSALELREYEFEVCLSPTASIVVSGNPLVNSASMINDVKGSEKDPNSEFFVVLAIALDGTSELHVLSQTTRLVKAGTELLVEYGDGYWKAWMKNRKAMKAARERTLLNSAYGN
jgi:hypothetical protein